MPQLQGNQSNNKIQNNFGFDKEVEIEVMAACGRIRGFNFIINTKTRVLVIGLPSSAHLKMSRIQTENE
jgi:hypothetical protein